MKNIENAISQPKGKATNIPIDKLHPFEHHPYKVRDDDEMEALTASIQDGGILTPLIVRSMENVPDEYEVISGHRRLHAAQRAGIKTVPALIYALDRDTAAIALVDSNLHREHILPSEKAFAYKLKMEAMSHQGKTAELTSRQVVGKLETADVISENESGRQVQRYIRLTNLIPPILDMVDEGRIAFTPAVELSYLLPGEQQLFLDEISSHDSTPNLSQAQRLKALSAEGSLTHDSINAVMSEEKANQKEMFKLPMEQFRKYLPKASPEQIQDFVMKACDHYQKYLHRQRERER